MHEIALLPVLKGGDDPVDLRLGGGRPPGRLFRVAEIGKRRPGVRYPDGKTRGKGESPFSQQPFRKRAGSNRREAAGGDETEIGAVRNDPGEPAKKLLRQARQTPEKSCRFPLEHADIFSAISAVVTALFLPMKKSIRQNLRCKPFFAMTRSAQAFAG